MEEKVKTDRKEDRRKKYMGNDKAEVEREIKLSKTEVLICTVNLNNLKSQWSLYVPHSGHYMYHQFNIQQFSVPHSVFMCFVWISEQTAIISLYSIN